MKVDFRPSLPWPLVSVRSHFPPPLVPCTVGKVILPDRHRPWRASLVKSAIYPGCKWFQSTTLTAYAHPFLLPIRPSLFSFRRCLTLPLPPLLLMTTYVANLTRPHAPKADPPFQIPDACIMTCDDDDSLAFPCVSVRFQAILSLTFFSNAFFHRPNQILTQPRSKTPRPSAVSTAISLLGPGPGQIDFYPNIPRLTICRHHSPFLLPIIRTRSGNSPSRSENESSPFLSPPSKVRAVTPVNHCSAL